MFNTQKIRTIAIALARKTGRKTYGFATTPSVIERLDKICAGQNLTRSAGIEVAVLGWVQEMENNPPSIAQ